MKYQENLKKILPTLIHPPIYFLYGIYLPIIFLLPFFLYPKSSPDSLWIFIYGLLSWTLVEYITHRFLFHHQSKNKLFKQFQFFIHGYHHLRPTDSKRYILPIFITLPLTLILILAAYIISAKNAGTFSSGFILGYLIYDSTHYAVHRFHPRTRIGKFLKYHHFYHHFKNNRRCFGVSTTLWDYVFKTKQF